MNAPAPGSVLVTGASGFIGGAVLAALGRAAPQRLVLPAGRQPPPGGLVLDLAAPAIQLPPGVHTVLHLAGEKRVAALMPAINAEGAVRLVEAAARAGARRFVHLSSVGVYGAPKHAGTVTESSPHTPQGPYETSKDAGERAVRERCAALGLACAVLQPSNVIGLAPGRGRPLVGLVRMVARGWFRHFGSRAAWVNYVAVEDVASALVAAALHEGAQGTWIVNTPAPLHGFVGWIADELGRPAPTARLPYWVGAAAAGAGALGRTLLRRDLPFSPERLRELSNTTVYDGRAITSALGWRPPRGIEAALRTLVRQYRQDGVV